MFLELNSFKILICMKKEITFTSLIDKKCILSSIFSTFGLKLIVGKRCYFHQNDDCVCKTIDLNISY